MNKFSALTKLNLGTDERPLPAWKLALMVGLPLGLVSAGAYLYIANSKNNKKEVEVERDDPEGQSAQEDNTNEGVALGKEAEIEKLKEQCLKLKNQGNKLFKKEKYSEALLKYDEAIAVCPESLPRDKATCHQNKAAALEKQENWPGVILECTEATKLHPRYTKAFLRRAKAHDKLSNLEQALEDITYVCMLEKFKSSANMIFADSILKKIGFTKSASRFISRGLFLPSKIFLKTYFQTFSRDPNMVPLTDEERAMAETSGYVRARIAYDEFRIEDLFAECEDEIEVFHKFENNEIEDPHLMDRMFKALLLRGTFYLICCKNNQALVDFDRIIKHEKDITNKQILVNALIKRACMRMSAEQFTTALDDFNQAIKIDPENIDIYHNRAQYYIMMNQPDNACADFDRCIEIDESFTLASAQKTYTKYRISYTNGLVTETEKSYADFEQLIEKYPDCSEAYGLLAQAEADRKNYQRADDLFALALEKDPTQISLHVHRGVLMMQWKEDYEQAKAIIKRALEVDASCDFAHEMLATIATHQNNPDLASHHFNLAVQGARTEPEMAHLFALKAAADAQNSIRVKYGVYVPQPQQL